MKECLIKKDGEIISTNRKNYSKVLTGIRQTMTTEEIIQNTKHNFKLTRETGERGYMV